MEKIIVYLDQEKGIHCRFGEEEKKVKEVLKNFENDDTAVIYISTPTQLLVLDILCQEKELELIIFDEDGKQFENVTAAHHYVNQEYITLDFCGLQEN